MNDTEIQNNEIKKQVKEPQYSPLRLIGILSLTFLCTILLIAATFTRVKVLNCFQPLIELIHQGFYDGINSIFAIKAYFYIPQIPVIFFTSALLGGACSMFSVFVYIVLGLSFLPVFGLGGGFDYILQPYFGYILAFIPAALVADKISDKDKPIKSVFIAAFIAALIVHIIGFLYMLLISIIQHQNLVHTIDWLIFESFTRFIYDFIFGSIAIFVGKFLRKHIWILTSI